MTSRKSFSLKLITFAICIFLSACSYGQKSKTTTNSEAQPDISAAVANIKNLLKKQVLLTNSAQFTNDRTLEGASGFLIKYNGANFAVTARHLLGEAGGVEPEVKINDLDKSLIKWEMMPRVVNNADKETVKLDVKGLDFSNSVSDFVLLKVLSKDFEIEILTPNFELPAVGETLFLIGCPYSETQCKQNYYQVKYVEFDDAANSIVFEMNSPVNLSGFSGAPVVNGKGEVLGILTSSFKTGGKDYSMATHIKEIQKITF